VQNHACGVNHASQRRLQQPGHFADDLCGDGLWFWRAARQASGNVVANPFEDGSRRVDDEVVADASRKFRKRRQAQQFAYRRNLAEQYGAVITSGIGCRTHSMAFQHRLRPQSNIRGQTAAVPDKEQRTKGQLTQSLPSFSMRIPPPPMPTNQTDEDLTRLERDIRQLKIEFEQYFGGGKKRPPADIEWRIEQVLKRYGDRSAQMNYGQRFRYGNLAQTYAKYREIFHKRMQKREDGTVERHFGAAAREIEAQRARSHPAASPSSVAITCSDLERESFKVDELYSAFREALHSSGEPVDRLSREKFQKFLLQKSEQIRKQRGQKVEFLVSVENGKARLKARVKS